MKHTWTLLLASLLLVFTLTACGGGDTQTNTPPAGDAANGNEATGGAIGGGATNGNGANGDTAGSGMTNGDDVNGTTAGNGGVTDDNGTVNGNANENVNGNGGDSLLDDAGNALNDAGRALDGAVGGRAVQQNQTGRQGASYGQMLRNARVHDQDGDLTDFENSVTPGSAKF